MATVNLSPLFNGQTIFGPTGLPLAGGQLFTYQAGSSTPLATFTTYNGTIANANPITIGSDGKLAQELWLQSGYSYKFVLQDADSATINTYDNIAGIITSIPASSATLPTGCIIIWSGSTGSIPSGFVICDGTNGTPDLRNSFVLGAGNAYTVGQTGGSTDAIVVTHSHTATSTSSSVVTDPGHYHLERGGQADQTGGSNVWATNNQPNATSSSATTTELTGITVATTTSTTNQSAGQSGTNANMPPYYALAYIMKT